MNEVTFVILKLVVSVISALLAIFILPKLNALLKKKTNGMDMEDLFDAVKIAVKAAEQTTGSGNGIVKKEKVVKQMHDWLNKHGITITEDQLNQLIEAAVYELNNGATIGLAIPVDEFGVISKKEN